MPKNITIDEIIETLKGLKIDYEAEKNKRKNLENELKNASEDKEKAERKLARVEEELDETKEESVKIKEELEKLVDKARHAIMRKFGSEAKPCDKCKLEEGGVKKTLYGYATKNYWGSYDTIKQPSKVIFLCRECSELEEQNHKLEAKFRDEMFRKDNGGYAGGGSVAAISDNVENWRKGWENLVGKGMDNVKEVVEGGIGLQYGAFKVGVGVGKDATVEAKLEEVEKFIVYLGDQLEEKNKRIRELEQLQVSQQEKQQEDQKFLFTKTFDAIVEVAGKSRDRAPSPTPPPYDKQ